MSIPAAELYRGIRLTAPEVTEAFFGQTLVPGSEGLDADGNPVVADGNELGVYMSDNKQMVLDVYGRPRAGLAVPNSPLFCRYPNNPRPVEYPLVGVICAITTEGLAVREPRITNALLGVYNNGYAGKEWIADSVPPTHYRPTQLVLGGGTLGALCRVPVKDVASGVRDLQAAYAHEQARTDEFAARVAALPEARRRSAVYVGRLLDEFRR